MYLLKAVAAMLSVFAVTYVVLSVLVAALWRRAATACPKAPAGSYANFLYLLRSAPLGFAFGFAVLFELPSFLRFEPRHANETLGWVPIVAVASCAAFGVVVLVRALDAWFRSEKLLRRWGVHSSIAEGRDLPVYDAREPAPLVAVSGLLSSRILVSGSARRLLSEQELRLAKAHEAAHARRHDNLRRFLLLLCSFPGMKSLEIEWSRAAEFAADDAAVRNQRDALELAAALLKVAAAPAHRAVSHPLIANLAGSAGSAVERVERLMDWVPPAEGGRRHSVRSLFAIAGVLAGIACLYPTLLRAMHVLTETLFAR